MANIETAAQKRARQHRACSESASGEVHRIHDVKRCEHGGIFEWRPYPIVTAGMQRVGGHWFELHWLWDLFAYGRAVAALEAEASK